MEIRFPASLRVQVLDAVRDALARDFPGAEIHISSFKAKLSAALPTIERDMRVRAPLVRFRGTGSESTHVTGSQYPIGGGETFSFKGIWERASGLISLTLKKLDNIYGAR